MKKPPLPIMARQYGYNIDEAMHYYEVYTDLGLFQIITTRDVEWEKTDETAEAKAERTDQ